MKGRLLLDVVVAQGATILELLTSEDKALLIRGDPGTATDVNFHVPQQPHVRNDLPLLVLDLSLHVVDRVGGLDLERDGLSSEGLHEDLHVCERGGCVGR